MLRVQTPILKKKKKKREREREREREKIFQVFDQMSLKNGIIIY
jgi:ribosomal protein S30